MMKWIKKGGCIFLVAIVAAVLLTGCLTINIGKPTTAVYDTNETMVHSQGGGM